MPKHVSELRKDLVTGDWVVIATGRARRPNEFARRRTREVPQLKASCPFERLFPNAILVYDRAGERYHITSKNIQELRKNWWVQVIPNKYPALGRGDCRKGRHSGPYEWQDGVGFHEVVVTRDHLHPIGAMSIEEVTMVLRAYRNRYLTLKDEKCVAYVSIFHNHGRDAGASIWHPHSQIIAIPVIPKSVGRSLQGSEEYYRTHQKCVHCTMIEFEKREQKRIVYRNKDFIVFCPFVSRQAFEIRVFPVRHNSDFSMIGDDEIVSAADALRSALGRLDRGLGNPPYNFFIHTAPTADGVHVSHYHWHIEIVPKTGMWAGFEISTGIQISTIAPEMAAPFLAKLKV